MNKLRSVSTAVLLCFLLALTLSACGTSNSTKAASTTGTSNINMSVAAGNQQVTVSWTDPNSTTTSNTTYNVYYSNSPFDASPKDDVTSKNPTVFLAATGTTSPFVHTGLTNGTTYYYFVTRVSGNTDGAPSLAAMAVPRAATPAAPTGVAISTGIQSSNNLGTVTLTIPNVDSTLTYNVYWSPSSGDIKSNGTKIANAFTISGTSATFTHNNLLLGTTYYYAVTAVGESESASSQVLSAKPVLTSAVSYSATGPIASQYGSPQSLQAQVSNQSVTITWGTPNSAPITDETSNTAVTKAVSATQTFTLYYWDASGTQSSATKIPNITSNTTSLTVNTGLTNGKTYDFYVAAVQNLFDSAGKALSSTPVETPSAVISVVPQAKVLAVPSAVAASAGDQQISLSWAKVSDPAGGAVKYNVYSSYPTSGSFSLIGTTTTNSFVHSGLATGKSYYYVITSVSDQAGESAQSNQVSISL